MILPLLISPTLWKVNQTLNFLGASIYLMATIGSWKDTLTDGEVLDSLRRWHEGGDEALGFDVSFVK